MYSIFLAVLVAQATVPPRDDWETLADKMERAIVRLPPSAFPDLPVPIQKSLNARGCTIPQAGGGSRPHNVVKGNFQITNRTDWAVLCSVKGISRILIYQGGSAAAVYEMPNSAQPDRGWLQVGPGYSRAIGTADADTINHYKDEFDGPEPPSIDHDGLEEAYVEKGSTIYYWHDGSWMQLQGSD